MPKYSHNDLCRCRKRGAWSTRQGAEAALQRIQDSDEIRDYTPTDVIRCPHGVWHLTSKTQKVWAKGKSRRVSRGGGRRR